MTVTAYSLAQRYAGIKELPGGMDHPLIRWWLSLCGFDPATTHDEVPWCSAFVNGIAWELDLPQSKSAAARSWLQIGTPITLDQAQPGYDVVVLSRGPLPQPGPREIHAQGHVGFFAGLDGLDVLLLAGNQSDAVNVTAFSKVRVLGVRRLYEEL